MPEEKKEKLNRKEANRQLANLIKEFQKKTFKTLQNKIAAENKRVIKNKSKKKETDSLQETIDYLRVCIKYTIYDLEATRREVVQLKKLLKDNGIEI